MNEDKSDLNQHLLARRYLQSEKANLGPECSIWFVIFEIGFANLPIIMFLITSYINFRQVKGSGFNKVVRYSVFFKIKLIVCVLAALLHFVSLVVVLIDPEIVDKGDGYS